MDQSRGAIMGWNVFRFCTVLRALGSVMIILVLGIVGFTYYAVVLVNYGPALFRGGLDSFTALALLVPFHALLVMLLWSYFSVVLTDPGGVPPNWRPPIDEERCDADLLVESAYTGPALASNDFSVYSESANQHLRWEVYSENGSPLHLGCKLCGRIELQFYTFLETTLVTLSLLPYFMAFFSDVEISGTPATLAASFIAFVLNLAFAISIMGFTAFEKNTTVKWSYDLGWKNNYEQDPRAEPKCCAAYLCYVDVPGGDADLCPSHPLFHVVKEDIDTHCWSSVLDCVFGTDKRYWLIPAYSNEDLRRMPALQGLEYPTVSEVEALQQL
ncbi:putative protein S-acyltransferase 14 [Senna tora]|uniref:Palmitoyltransferase n=1 Tax=Senna tora TaxID=362788 RepID=A0A834TTU1_9FABA|nr:putative protein S-acyltransferase 14 [Senna tora]